MCCPSSGACTRAHLLPLSTDPANERQQAELLLKMNSGRKLHQCHNNRSSSRRVLQDFGILYTCAMRWEQRWAGASGAPCACCQKHAPPPNDERAAHRSRRTAALHHPVGPARQVAQLRHHARAGKHGTGMKRFISWVHQVGSSGKSIR